MAQQQTHWQDIQQNTFTRWVNQHVARRGYHINDLGKDLKDGIVLCNLLEIISQKSLGRWNKNPKVPQQKLENCQIAVDFVQKEGIKLVNISGSDINDCRLKLILGFIWTLILRYQIHQGADSAAEDELLKWVRSKIPEYNIQNFTKDWNDGKAICALVNALRPGLCTNHASLSSADSLGNATKGITLGEEKLGVAALILPAEMIHPKVDKLAMMTYISQYRDLKDFTDADRCEAYGHGLTDGIVGIPSSFYVETPHGCTGKLEVKVYGPKSEAKVDVKNDNGKYTVSYTPTEAGIYKVHVTLDKKHIPGSIFTVVVLDQESLGGEGKIRVFFSTTSSSEKGRQDNFALEQLLTIKKIHLRPDFEPWIPVDIMDREDREAVFRKAGTRHLPIVFIDDKYAGDYDTMAAHEESGKLNQLINMMGYEKQGYTQGPPPKTDELKKVDLSSTTSSAPKVDAITNKMSNMSVSNPSAASTSAPVKKFCGSCGAKAAAGAFCGECGSKL